MIDAAPGHPPLRTSTILLAAASWLAVAILVAATGAATRLRPPAPQLVVLVLTAALVALGHMQPRFRAWLDGLDIRAIVALHLTRGVAGTALLLAASRGVLPRAFALPAGYGDITVALLAAFLIVAVRPSRGWAPALYSAWNVLGLLDILGVVANAARTALADPAGMTALLRLPFALLPLFLVPVIIASHVLLSIRLAAHRRGAVTRQR
jgi:hypothetical protein